MAEIKSKFGKVYIWWAVVVYMVVSWFFEESGIPFLSEEPELYAIIVIVMIAIIIFLYKKQFTFQGNNSPSSTPSNTQNRVKVKVSQIAKKTILTWSTQSKHTSLSGNTTYNNKNTSRNISSASNEAYSAYSLDGK